MELLELVNELKSLLIDELALSNEVALESIDEDKLVNSVAKIILSSEPNLPAFQ
jgi:hypothetical protein